MTEPTPVPKPELPGTRMIVLVILGMLFLGVAAFIAARWDANRQIRPSDAITTPTPAR